MKTRRSTTNLQGQLHTPIRNRTGAPWEQKFFLIAAENVKDLSPQKEKAPVEVLIPTGALEVRFGFFLMFPKTNGHCRGAFLHAPYLALLS